jgi:hypothetical protein
VSRVALGLPVVVPLLAVDLVRAALDALSAELGTIRAALRALPRLADSVQRLGPDGDSPGELAALGEQLTELLDVLNRSEPTRDLPEIRAGLTAMGPRLDELSRQTATLERMLRDLATPEHTTRITRFVDRFGDRRRRPVEPIDQVIGPNFPNLDSRSTF